MKKQKAYIIAAKRTTIAPLGGCLRNQPYEQLAKYVLNACLKQAQIVSQQVDRLIVSNAMSGGGNPARFCALATNFPSAVKTLSLDHQCVGGLDAILRAVEEIQHGLANIILAGGTESCSLKPKRLYKTRWKEPYVLAERPPFFPGDFQQESIAVRLNALAQKFLIDAVEQEEWTRSSHQKALVAKNSFQDELVTFQKGLPVDPYARTIGTALYQRAKPLCGSINSCNTAPYADGAAFVVVVNEAVFKQLKPYCFVEVLEGYSYAGNPTLFALHPQKVLHYLCQNNHVKLHEIEHLELMEAYAAQALLTVKDFPLDLHKINRGGGALARGHPIGASGAVLMVRLFYELQKKKGKGLAVIPGVGGLASGILVTR